MAMHLDLFLYRTCLGQLRPMFTDYLCYHERIYITVISTPYPCNAMIMQYQNWEYNCIFVLGIHVDSLYNIMFTGHLDRNTSKALGLKDRAGPHPYLDLMFLSESSMYLSLHLTFTMVSPIFHWRFSCNSQSLRWRKKRYQTAEPCQFFTVTVAEPSHKPLLFQLSTG